MLNNKKFLEHKGPTIDRVGKYRVIDCQRCLFKHVDPIPGEAEITTFYKDKFYNIKKPNYLKYSKKDLDWWMATYKNYYQIFRKHTRGSKLLDIGSGPGYFIKCGQGLGWNTLGFEPSGTAYKHSKKLGINVVNDFFDYEKAKQYGKFDVVCLNLVLEHLVDPTKVLKDVKKILSKKGLLFILSPNDYNPFQMILKQQLGFKSWWVVPLEHINYFDFSSIKKLLKKLGFSIIDLLATYPMETFLLSGENYIGNDKIGRKCHKKRIKFEMNLYKHNPELLNIFYRSLAQNNLGREFVVIAKHIK